MVRLLLTVAAIAAGVLLRAQGATTPPSTPSGFLSATLEVEGTEYPYVLYVPRDYVPDRDWPLIVFLHGAGECGTDGLLQLAAGLPPAIVKNAAEWPFIVLIPQKPDRASAWEDHETAVMAMLDRTQREFSVDDHQLFLTGLSQGGHGTWVLGTRHKDLWAAVAPVCGYGNPELVAGLAATPCWAFHGDADRAVPLRQSQALIAAVEAAGGTPQLTIYPGVGHNSWDQAYGDEGLAGWFLGHGAERALRACFKKSSDLRGARVVLRKAWKSDGAPHVGVETLRIKLDSEELTWRKEVVYGKDARMHSPPPEPVEVSLGRGPGLELLRQRLLQLTEGGALMLPPNARPEKPSGTVTATERWSINLHLERADGSFDFEREVPEGCGFDPRYAGGVRSLREFLDAFAAPK